MLKAEWQSIWKDKKLALSIVVMFIMPVLYAGMLLWAFWDPYGKIDQLPVAVVNEDKGADFEGEQLAIGNELIDNLLDSKTFQFIEVDAADVEQGLLDQKYYLYIRIPENFSQHATTLLDENPEKLEIEYKANEGYNFLSSKIGNSAITEIRNEVNEKVAKTYAEQLFTAINQLGDGFVEAGDGAVKVQDGAVEVANGVQDLKGYLAQLAESTVSLSNGTEKLYNGVATASNGAGQLVDGSKELANGANALTQGANELATGANGLASGVESYVAGVADLHTGQAQVVEKQQQLVQGANSLAQGASTLSTNLEQVQAGANHLATATASLQQAITQLPAEQQAALQTVVEQIAQSSTQLAQGAGAVTTGATQLATSAQQLAQGTEAMQGGQQQVLAGIEKLQSNSTALVTGATNVAQGSTTVHEKLNALSTGATTLVNGTQQLASGLTEVVAGSASLNNGTSELTTKSADLAQGSVTLADGTQQLVDGSKELSDALLEAGAEAKISADERNYDMLASPVDVDEEIKFESENYGTGLAPYFISLGLFVGALLLTNVYPFVQPAKHPTGVVSWFMSKTAVPFIVWIFQVVIMILVVKLGLGLETANMGKFIVVVAITSFCFLAIVQMFTVLLGDVGRFISLVFLIVQLASSAGTFPVELIPDKLQLLHEFMPMTYSVRAFRAVISNSSPDVLATCLTILSVVGVVCMIISFAFFILLYKRRYSKAAEV